MLRTLIFIFTTIFFSTVNTDAMTLHVLWITAENETGENELGLKQASNPNLESFSEEHFDYIPLEEQGHRIKHYRFGKDKDCPLEKNAILRFISNLSVDSEDAVMIYYRGHGGYDKESESNKYAAKQYYSFVNDNGLWDFLPHSEVRLAVEKLRLRLAVFIRDCCGSWIEVPTRGVTPDPEMFAAAQDNAERRRPRREQKLFLSLFVHSRGVVDIASAKEGFAAMAQRLPKNLMSLEINETHFSCGTVFSNSFDKIFDINRSQALSWQQFFGLVIKETENRFQRTKPDNKIKKAVGKHTPHCFVFGGIYAVPNFQERLAKSTIPTGYLGFSGEPVFGGVRLTRVDENSRAAAYGLEANKMVEGKRVSDIIYAVDGILVTTNKELDLACRIFGDDGAIKFTLINGRDESIQDFSFPDIRAEIVK
ncbi:MAG: caspase family protein [Planctomycetaceae bacterium]|jgi:hypothetical protein|nr:caspase family protein [Planctomycetaceae bacterium]